MAKWYEIKAAAPVAQGEAPKPAELLIYGNIGDRWNEDGVVASELVRDLSALQADTINLRINSYGGSVPDGLAIYNALRRHKATVNVFVDGVAISCASYIAMAGDTITMSDKGKRIPMVVESLAEPALTRPEWLSFNESEGRATVTRLPDASEVPFPVEVQHVVEYYAVRI